MNIPYKTTQAAIANISFLFNRQSFGAAVATIKATNKLKPNTHLFDT